MIRPRRLLLLAALLGTLVAAAPALASERNPTLQELEGEVMCPTCNSLLELSHSPVSDRIRAFILERIEAGDTKSEIKDALVAEFGTRVLAAPPTEGANVIVWVLPLVGALVAIVVIGLLLRRWSRSRPVGQRPLAAGDGVALDPELDRRLEDELRRFDS
ncbi:MAG: cytochrome c-type biogenesis protein [Thermoleophilia bacterium]